MANFIIVQQSYLQY